MKEYKPIVVVYLNTEMDMKNLDILKQTLDKAGYKNVLVVISSESEPRVEIISVDKATVVEDIQKYIDLKSFEKKKEEIKIPHVPDEDLLIK